MPWRALVITLLLAPAAARSGESRVAQAHEAPRAGCRLLAYRAYLLCVAAETKLLASGAHVAPTTCTTVMEAVKRDCRAEGSVVSGGAG